MTSSPAPRTATISRDTNETKIQVSLSLDGGQLPVSAEDVEAAAHPTLNGPAKDHATQASASQQISIDTGIGFLDHMLHALAKHAGWSLRVRSRGDLHGQSRNFYPILHTFSNLGKLTGPFPYPQSTTITPPRTRLSPWAAPSGPRWAPPPAWPGSGTPTLRSTRPWPGPSSICRTGPFP